MADPLEPLARGAGGVGDGCRGEDPPAERLAQSLDPVRLVHGRTDNREIKPVLGPDVAVEDVAEMQRDVDIERSFAGLPPSRP